MSLRGALGASRDRFTCDRRPKRRRVDDVYDRKMGKTSSDGGLGVRGGGGGVPCGREWKEKVWGGGGGGEGGGRRGGGQS